MKRTKEDVPIGNVKTIVDSIESVGETPWFLFINETSTHAPYVFNDQALESEINAKIKQRFVRHKALFQGKVDPNITYENTGKVFEQAQIAALNFFDSQLQKLIEKLKQTTRRNVLLIICGDHGECFGDATFMGEKKSGYFGHCWNGAEENIVVPLLINIIKPESNQED